jgi:hypothetical protein
VTVYDVRMPQLGAGPVTQLVTLTTEEVAALCHLTPARIVQLRAEGKITGFKARGTRRWLFFEADVREFMLDDAYAAEDPDDTAPEAVA